MGQVDMVDDPSIYFQKLTCDSIDVTPVNFTSKNCRHRRIYYKSGQVKALYVLGEIRETGTLR